MVGSGIYIGGLFDIVIDVIELFKISYPCINITHYHCVGILWCRVIMQRGKIICIVVWRVYRGDLCYTEAEARDRLHSEPYLVLFYFTRGLEQEGGSLITPMALAHPLHPIDNRSRNKRRNLWVGRCVSSWWPWFPSRNSVLIYMYIYICVHSLYEFCYRSYIQRECHSVLAKLHPITFYIVQ